MGVESSIRRLTQLFSRGMIITAGTRVMGR
jgi:hypothetical protein